MRSRGAFEDTRHGFVSCSSQGRTRGRARFRHPAPVPLIVARKVVESTHVFGLDGLAFLGVIGCNSQGRQHPASVGPVVDDSGCRGRQRPVPSRMTASSSQVNSGGPVDAGQDVAPPAGQVHPARPGLGPILERLGGPDAPALGRANRRRPCPRPRRRRSRRTTGRRPASRPRMPGSGRADAAPSVTTAASSPRACPEEPGRQTPPPRRPGGGRGGSPRGRDSRRGGPGRGTLRRTSAGGRRAGGS